jgi:LysM repeat protein
MKRRTRLIIIGCATVGGTLTSAAQAASATTNQRPQSRAETAPTTSVAPQKILTVATRRAPTAAPKAQAPLPKVTIQPGDTLSAIGARVSRTWVQLAGFNHISNPDLIYPGEILTVPPASYAATSVASSSDPVTNPASPRTFAAYGSSSAGRYTQTPHTYAASTPSGVWACIASHESGGNPGTNTGNGYYGMYQFTMGTWLANGGSGNPANASAAQQLAVAQRVQATQGWGAWPVSSSACGA